MSLTGFSQVTGPFGSPALAGTVTQTISSSTGVTLSTMMGQITTVALITGANLEDIFTVTNTLVDATDVIVLSTSYAGTGTPILSVIKTTTGAFDIVIANVGAAALNAAMTINFAVIKTVTAS
jgi:hypothetical protein